MKSWISLFISLHWITLLVVLNVVDCNPDAMRLYDNLLRKSGYNKLIRPVGNITDLLTVKLGLRLSQLIDVHEKDQIMTTNVWLRHEWMDYKLSWKPIEYGGVSRLYVPSEEIWLPDIVLYTNADGNYEVTLMTKATLHPNGLVVWEPPAIYKSSCPINVEFFPFDEQLCTMKFGSWTYDGYQVDLKHINQSEDSNIIENGVDLADFYRSVEWDILSVPAQRKEIFYTCCPEPYLDITFSIKMRRKTLFYTVNLIIPCVAISFLTVLVFYLPSDSGEKVTLCISILLSLTVFILLLADIIPPTSLVVPLIGKYLLFTMILVTLSIIVTVIVLNVHFRSPSTHTMSPWVRRVFLNILPRLLMMPRPSRESVPGSFLPSPSKEDFGTNSREFIHQRKKSNHGGRGDSIFSNTVGGTADENNLHRKDPRGFQGNAYSQPAPVENNNFFSSAQNHQIKLALESVNFIAEHLRNEDECVSIKEDWKYVAMVLDRLFLWIFTLACVIGTFGIILQAPTLYDNRVPIA